MNKSVKKILVTIAKKNVFAREIMYKVMLSRDKSRYMKFYNSEKVDDKLCVFEAFNGRKYCDSPKAIYLEMLNDKIDKVDKKLSNKVETLRNRIEFVDKKFEKFFG